jgi:O-antigen/teichoic acid export membrane protein
MEALAAVTSAGRGRDVLHLGASQFGVQGLQFIASLVLARLLTPHAYGVVAIALVFSGFVGMFSEIGLDLFLIRSEEIDEAAITTVFYFNLIAGFVVAIVLAGLAFPLAAIYNMPELKLVMVLCGVSAVTNVFIVPLSILERLFRFRLLAIVELVCALISVGVTVTLAVYGAGAKSLVIGPIAGTLLESIWLWCVVRVPISGRPSRTIARKIVRLAAPLAGSNSVAYWTGNVDSLIIGLIAGPVTLGLYAKAYALMYMAGWQAAEVVERVLTPALSRQQDAIAAMRGTYTRSMRLSMAAFAPLGIGLACLASPFIVVLYGSKWHGAAHLLQALALSIPLVVLNRSVLAVYAARGNLGPLWRRTVVQSVCMIAGIGIGAIWGAMGIAIGFTVGVYATTAYCVKLPWAMLDMSLLQGVRPLLPPFLASLIMGAALLVLNHYAHSWPVALWLLSGVAGGAAVYVGALGLLDRRVLLDVFQGLVHRSSAV